MPDDSLAIARRNPAVGQSAQDRIGRAERRTRQGQVGSELTGGPREQPAATDIGGETDPDLGHRADQPLGRQPMRRVAREPDSSAHRDAVHERDDGFREFGDTGVEVVFGAPEMFGATVPGDGRCPHGNDAPAGAEGSIPRTLEKDGFNGGGLFGDVESMVKVVDHCLGEGIERLGAVERDPERMADNLADHLLWHDVSLTYPTWPLRVQPSSARTWASVRMSSSVLPTQALY